MKKYVLLIVLFVSAEIVFGQTTEEWIEQDKTQIKYLLQQIAAQKVYLDYLEKGYDIAMDGLHAIRDIKKGDFNLHSDYFNSLKEVNSKIKNSARFGDIISLQSRIIKKAKSTIEHVRECNQFTYKEIGYVKNVFDHLLDECSKDIEVLITIVTSGELEMKDDERINRIDKIYDEMQDKFSFCNSFSNQASVLGLQREGDQYEVNRIKKLNGLQ